MAPPSLYREWGELPGGLLAFDEGDIVAKHFPVIIVDLLAGFTKVLAMLLVMEDSTIANVLVHCSDSLSFVPLLSLIQCEDASYVHKSWCLWFAIVLVIRFRRLRFFTTGSAFVLQFLFGPLRRRFSAFLFDLFPACDSSSVCSQPTIFENS